MAINSVVAASSPRITAFAVARSDLDEAVESARRQGYDPGDVQDFERRTTAGKLLRWRLAYNHFKEPLPGSGCRSSTGLRALVQALTITPDQQRTPDAHTMPYSQASVAIQHTLGSPSPSVRHMPKPLYSRPSSTRSCMSYKHQCADTKACRAIVRRAEFMEIFWSCRRMKGQTSNMKRRNWLLNDIA